MAKDKILNIHRFDFSEKYGCVEVRFDLYREVNDYLKRHGRFNDSQLFDRRGVEQMEQHLREVAEINVCGRTRENILCATFLLAAMHGECAVLGDCVMLLDCLNKARLRLEEMPVQSKKREFRAVVRKLLRLGVPCVHLQAWDDMNANWSGDSRWQSQFIKEEISRHETQLENRKMARMIDGLRLLPNIEDELVC